MPDSRRDIDAAVTRIMCVEAALREWPLAARSNKRWADRVRAAADRLREALTELSEARRLAPPVKPGEPTTLGELIDAREKLIREGGAI